jgi:hypothetical protein
MPVWADPLGGSSAGGLLRGWDAGESKRFVVGRTCPVRDDHPVTHGDYPCAGRVALGSADTPSDPAATRNHDEPADVPVLLALGLEDIPECGWLISPREPV